MRTRSQGGKPTTNGYWHPQLCFAKDDDDDDG
jgi:hypothetical protein